MRSFLAYVVSDKLYRNFIIPELPSGDALVVDILSTWGDKHYVGLNGIEIFSNTGEPAKIKKIYADMTSIAQTQDNNYDSRVVNNLINGINRTRDDANLWLTPYSNGDHHYVYIIFECTITVAMIRIWVGFFFFHQISDNRRKNGLLEIVLPFFSRIITSPGYIPFGERRIS